MMQQGLPAKIVILLLLQLWDMIMRLRHLYARTVTCCTCTRLHATMQYAAMAVQMILLQLWDLRHLCKSRSHLPKDISQLTAIQIQDFWCHSSYYYYSLASTSCPTSATITSELLLLPAQHSTQLWFPHTTLLSVTLTVTDRGWEYSLGKLFYMPNMSPSPIYSTGLLYWLLCVADVVVSIGMISISTFVILVCGAWCISLVPLPLLLLPSYHYHYQPCIRYICKTSAVGCPIKVLVLVLVNTNTNMTSMISLLLLHLHSSSWVVGQY